MISAEFLHTVYVLVYACTGLVGRTDTSTSIRMEVVWNTEYTSINIWNWQCTNWKWGEDRCIPQTICCIQNHTTVVQNCNTGQEYADQCWKTDLSGYYAELCLPSRIMPKHPSNQELCRKLFRHLAVNPNVRVPVRTRGLARARPARR